MKLIRITTDLKISTHDFPTGTYSKQNAVLRELIGNGCGTIEHVRPMRLYEELGCSTRITRAPSKAVSMLVDEEFLCKRDLEPNLVGCWLYGTDRHRNPILENILIIGEKLTDDGIDFCGIDEEVFDGLLKSLADVTCGLREVKEMDEI